MSLQGTFDVVALSDLLRMLAAGHKSGELVMEAGGAAGRIDFHDGACIAAESTDVRGPANDESELHRRAIDVCFAVSRYPGGSFRFAATESNEARHAVSIAVEPLLGELELLKAEWDEICEVVPSTDLRPVLAAQLGGAEITISATEWAMLARVDGYTSVSDLVDVQRESLVDVCRCVAELIRRGALELREPTTLSARSDTSADASDERGAHDGSDPNDHPDQVAYFGPRVVPVAPYGPGVDEHVGVVAAVAEVASGADERQDLGVGAANHHLAVASDGGVPDPTQPAIDAAVDPVVDGANYAEAGPTESSDPRDRGAILRLFSGLREA